ncbi:hypothetical protein BMA10247_0957 [Burkholderia mallei NCTC 10247]|uniref:Uncharacterized protein n=1 Tax=Burkholderia mallei (strain NCTC 10229) TaxID=412022 RepID=A2S2P0_BURM9|nr:hypothetical protein BMA10229_A0207 [Burkholderia mallei NCTC 10229]ABO07237.1 hypothetical protein BMA10247_0957 [Burkholderia mallei NCTC 10247]EDK60572.1 hypothetical protein BMAJHU_C0662 [Burkholderia mallei JHU]EDO91927.1 hypothetical protein BURPSPAST_AA0373 [Burkholderia pseudomallei Pasteur 52237]
MIRTSPRTTSPNSFDASWWASIMPPSPRRRSGSARTSRVFRRLAERIAERVGKAAG